MPLYNVFEDARRVPIISVAERLGLHLHRRGREQRINCPNHTYDDCVDSRPSCSLNERFNRFHCWSCGNKGSVIDLVIQVNGWRPLEAAKWITGR